MAGSIICRGGGGRSLTQSALAAVAAECVGVAVGVCGACGHARGAVGKLAPTVNEHIVAVGFALDVLDVRGVHVGAYC